MNHCVAKRFVLEMAETSKIRLDSAIDLKNLPYPTNFFSHVFHVDVFYFLRQEDLPRIAAELLRVLQPGASVSCAMQFSKLKRLTEYGLLSESQWDPLRYLSAMEYSKFEDVKITYENDKNLGEYQILTARKPIDSFDSNDPEAMMNELAKQIKEERVNLEFLKNRRRKPDFEEKN
ncbi:unnamed protein product [Caenorhabditis auriculariae]|uniref:Methyltransferase type 11 domain-containing protein n=1 Tax=Caenorhabditis auriculariae TaxID=2777116 RepID=A0A8S1H7W5_9PELO|nr:unnamed protein product [Caenorhabditis auriculariae]